MSGSVVTPWTVVHQAPLFTGFPGQENWSRLPCSSPGDLPEPGTEPVSPALAGRFFTPGSPRKPFNYVIPWKEEPGRLQSMGSQRVGHH